MTHYRDRLEAGEFDPPKTADDLDAMTKAELIEHAKSVGVEVSETATKGDVRKAIEEASQ
jgi:hypothetical protein